MAGSSTAWTRRASRSTARCSPISRCASPTPSSRWSRKPGRRSNHTQSISPFRLSRESSMSSVMMKEEISVERLESGILAEISTAADERELESVRVAALGKKGVISERMKELGSLDPEARRATGALLNRLKERVTEALTERRDALREAALEARLATERLDVTLPPRPSAAGSVHPVSHVLDEVVEIFGDLGFGVAEGPHIETDWYNFGALNI